MDFSFLRLQKGSYLPQAVFPDRFRYRNHCCTTKRMAVVVLVIAPMFSKRQINYLSLSWLHNARLDGSGRWFLGHQ